MKQILVVGGGAIGIRHLQAVQQDPACALMGLVDPDMSIAPDVPRFSAIEDVAMPFDGVIIAAPANLSRTNIRSLVGHHRQYHALVQQLKALIADDNIGDVVAMQFKNSVTEEDMVWITGTKGAMSFPSMTVWSGVDWGVTPLRVPQTLPLNTTSPLEAQLLHFVEVMDGAPPLMNVTDATCTLALDIETQLNHTNTIQCRSA